MLLQAVDICIESKHLIISLFNKRKQLFAGTGTVSMLKLFGHDIKEAEAAISSDRVRTLTPIAFLKVIGKTGKRWVVFQCLGWIFVGLVYATAIPSIFLLFIKKQITALLFFTMPIIYFLVTYLYDSNTRYFMAIVPFLAALSAYFIASSYSVTQRNK